MYLYNKLNKEECLKILNAETFERTTISFYRYVIIEDTQEFRDSLYKEWLDLGCFGRIYVAREGINAQMSVPTKNLEKFLEVLDARAEFKDMPIKYAVEDDGKSFYKLMIKLRQKILADGLEDDAYDVTNVGHHMTAEEFHAEVSNKDNLVIDMRNHYESEVGRFQNAHCPDVDTFAEEIKMVVDQFKDQKDKKVMLYCTGGIRCEKASAYLKHHGFKDVNQLHGGIIEYAQQMKKLGIKSKFIGKNFVFDERLGESINGEVISNCHQCGEKSDDHTNCANNDCHLLFIQCADCKEARHGCCSQECQQILVLPIVERRELRKALRAKYSNSKIYRSRIRPKLRSSVILPHSEEYASIVHHYVKEEDVSQHSSNQ